MKYHYDHKDPTIDELSVAISYLEIIKKGLIKELEGKSTRYEEEER